jgi:hypothetical protein
MTKNEDAVYSYKERTNAGLLAAAAVANGWMALEECRTDKNSSDESDDEVYQGRSDIRIWRDARHHEIEAKFLRVAFASESTQRLTKTAIKALEDSSRSVPSGDKFDRKIAVTFVVPTMTVAQLSKTTDAEMEEYRSKLIKQILSMHPSFIAYTFPGAVKAVGSPNRRALGVILFGSEPKET